MKKILSMICALALMITMFSVPTGAAEQLVAYDYGTITCDALDYDFMLGVVTASAATTGDSTGLRQMSCSMYIVTNSGVHYQTGSGTRVMDATISGYGEISTAQSTCYVNGAAYNIRLVV